MAPAVDQGEHLQQGWIEAAARILVQLLRSTRTMDNLRLILNNIDPHNTSELVRVALETDPAVPLALLGALPRGANVVVEATRELALYAARKPRALVREAGRGLWQRVRLERAGEAVGLLLSVGIGALEPEGLTTERTERTGDAGGGTESGLASERLTTARAEHTEGMLGDESQMETDGAEGMEGGANRFLAGLTAATRQQLGRAPVEVLAPLLLRWIGTLAAETERVLERDGAPAEALRDWVRGVGPILQRNPRLRRQLVAPLLESLHEE